MSELSELIERRKLLVAQSSLQRAVLAQNVAPWRPRLALVDRGIAAVEYMRRYPAVTSTLGFLVAALRPNRISRWLEHGWVLWQLGRGLRSRRTL